MTDAELFTRLDAILASGGRAVLVTVVRTQGSTPRKAGAKMIVAEDGRLFGTIGGGCIEAEVYAKARLQFEHPKPCVLSFSLNEADAAAAGLKCGGTLEIFMERIMPRNLLYLIGAGHVSHALAGIASSLGFEIHVIDDHPKFASAERFPGATVHLGDFAPACRAVPSGAHVAVVIATRGHAEDARSLETFVGKTFGYFGVITSKKRMIELGQVFVAAGGKGEEVERWRAPAGLDIGAESPEEIAVAVCAEMLCDLKGGTAQPLSDAFHASPAGAKLRELLEK